MIYRTPTTQINNYYERLGINQSALKVLLVNGIDTYLAKRDELTATNDRYYEEKEYFIIGSAVDCYITQGKEEFEKQYYISQLEKKPSDKLMSIVRMVYGIVSSRTNPSRELSSYRNEIYLALNEHAFYMKDAKATPELDTRIDSRVLKTKQPNHVHEYFRDLFNSNGKQILSTEQESIILGIVMALLTHKFTAYLFKETKGIDVIYQLPCFFEHNESDCKAMIDKVFISHTDKTITGLDLKTLGDYVIRFNKHIKARRYDMQGSYYTLAIRKCVKLISEIIGIDVSAYEITNFGFIACSTVKIGTPLIYILNDDIMEEGRIGRQFNHTSMSENALGLLQWNEFEGYEQALELYKEWQGFEFNIEKKYPDGIILLTNNYKLNL